MPTESGIQSTDPLSQSAAVTAAVTGEISYENMKTDDDSVVGQLQSMNTLLQTTQPSIKQDVASIATSVAKLTDVMSSKNFSMSLDLVGDGGSVLSNILKFAKKGLTKLLFAGADALYYFMSTVAKAEKFVTPVDRVVESINNFAETLGKIGKSLMKSTAALALLGATIFMIGNYFTAEPAALLAFAAAMTVVGATLWVFNKLVDENDLIKTVVAIALLGATVFMIANYFTAEPESIITFAASMLVVGGAIFAFNKFINPKDTLATAISLAIFGGALYVLSLGIENFNGIPWETLAIAGAAVVGSGAAMAGVGAIAGLVLTGAATMVAVSAATYLLAKAMQAMSEVDIDLEQLGRVGIATAAIVGALALIGNPLTLPFVLAGAAQMIVVSAATFLIAKALDSVNNAVIPNDTVMDNFTYGATALRDTFISIGNPLYLPLMLSGLAQAAMITVSTVALAGAMWSVSKMPLLEPEQYDTFKYGVITLADIFADIGGPIKLIKITAGAGVITLISAATIAIATGIRLFSAIISDPSTVEKSTEALDKFITGTVTSFTKFDTRAYATVAAGISAFQGISNLVSEIAQSVISIGNLTFETKEMRDGKLVTVSTRSFTPEDFDKVGKSIGLIIQSLTAPLAAIGEETTGVLFKSNKVKKGIEALEGIGSILLPITSIVDTFMTKNITESSANAIGITLQTLISGISGALSSINGDLDEDAIELMEDGVDALSTLINTITDDKFTGGVAQFGKLQAYVADIKDSINEMDLDKLSKLNDFMINVQHIEDNEALEQLAEAMRQLAEALQPSAASTSNSATTNNSLTNTITSGSAAKQQDSEILSIITDGNDAMRATMSQIYELLTSGQIKVRTQPIMTI